MSSENPHPTDPSGIDPAGLHDAVDRVMGAEQDPTAKPNPFDNPLFRREAGEGWHPDGLSKRLLGAIIAREAIGDEMAAVHDEEERAILMEDYKPQADFVNELKQQLGIGDPPPRTDS